MTKDAKNTVCRDTVKDVRWAQPWGQNFDLSDLMWAIHNWYLSCIGEWSTEAHCRIAGWKKPRMSTLLSNPINLGTGRKL